MVGATAPVEGGKGDLPGFFSVFSSLLLDFTGLFLVELCFRRSSVVGLSLLHDLITGSCHHVLESITRTIPFTELRVAI